MGPEATVDFMAKVIAATPAETDQDHVRLLVDQNPSVPSRQAALLDDGEDPGPAMAAMAVGLQNAGADFLVLPCNTAFAFAPAIRTAVRIPLVSIVDVTVDACRGYGTVGILATAGCLAANLYQDALAAANITLVLPEEDEVDEIQQLVFRVKNGDRGEEVGSRMQRLAERLVRRGAEAIVAACTEIPLVLKPNMLGVPLVSSTDVLAEVTAAICTGDAELPQGK